MLLPLKNLKNNYNCKLRNSRRQGSKELSFKCSEFFFNRGNFLTSVRTMDFARDLNSKLVVNNRGMKRESYVKNVNGEAFSWTSKYGSVTVNCSDFAVTDGMNEKGLSGAILWLMETKFAQSGQKPVLSYAKWIQYFLDNCEDVEQVINESKNIDIVPYVKEGFNENNPAPLHAIFHDKKGETAILEYKEGNLHIYEPKVNPVLTNDPFYPEQIQNFEQYKEKTLISEPTDSKDRFINLSLLLDKINPHSISTKVIDNINKILDHVTIKPKESLKESFSTLWSVIRDHGNLTYYFKLSDSSFFNNCIDLKNIDFSA